jgi:hypothetical protein
MKQEQKERLIELLCLYPIIDTAVGIFIIGIALMLGTFPSLLLPAVLIGIAGWWFIGNTYWRYEAYRASGPRGTYWNPGGSFYDAKTVLIWWTFGVFLSMAHSFCRRGYYCSLVEKYEAAKQKLGFKTEEESE